MELQLQRTPARGEVVMGDLLLDTAWHAFTLENAAHLIPIGRYRVLLTVSNRCCLGHLWSPRRDHVLPLIDGVPGRAGIRIHSANWAPELDGCVAVGQARTAEALLHSQLALVNLMDRLETATKTIWLEVFDPPPVKKGQKR